jgi:predicted metal-dependent phosphoesterase TrpH
MNAADLHCHSDYSDGSLPIQRVVNLAKSRGLTAVSIADHDTLAGYMQENLYREDIMVIPGIEISANDYVRGRRVHILGYGMKDLRVLHETCAPYLVKRHETALVMISILRKLGYDILPQDALQYTGPSGMLYRQHIMRALMDKGYTDAIYGPVYKELFGRCGKVNIRFDYIEMRDAVHIICESGGRAFLAHPFVYDSLDALPELVDAGLSGIEKFYPTHTPEQEKICCELVKRYNLIPCGGTDYHGAYGERPDLPGNCGLADAELKRFLESIELHDKNIE